MATITAPETLEATCAPSGLKVSSRTVTATEAGVRILVSSSAPAGTYANFSWDGGGQGDPAPQQATMWTLPTPPGELHISCSTMTKEGAAQSIRITDPQHHWASTTMWDLNCPPGATPAWTIPGPGHGATAQAAVENLLSLMKGIDWTGATAKRAPVGYPEAPAETWIVSLSGRPEISVSVSRAGAAYEALPDTLCHP